MIKNDLPQMPGSALYHKLRDYTELSFSYLLLLVASSIITTLGLLIDNSSVIIGGMIIAPLMWPLLKVSVGISFDSRSQVKDSIGLLVLSVLIGVGSAFLVTVLSPFKQLNSEIISRTTPTLIDLIIAIFAGIVASFAVLRPKISDTLAGVAIAASLMPPLAVSGIGLAVLDISVFASSLLLFFVNVLAIIFVSIIVFSFLTNKLHPAEVLKRKSFLVIFFALGLTSIPLIFFLRSYSFEVNAYSSAQQVLSDSLAEVSPSLFVSNVSINILSAKKVSVTADVLVPEGQTLTYQEQEKLISDLSTALQRDVDLNLRLQSGISLVTEDDSHTSSTIQSIRDAFTRVLSEDYPLLTVDSVEVADIGIAWQIKSTLRSPQEAYFTVQDLNKVKTEVSKVTKERVELVLDVIPRVRLKTADNDTQSQLLGQIESVLSAVSSEIDVTSFYLANDTAYLELRIPQSANVDVTTLKQSLSALMPDYTLTLAVTYKVLY